MREWPFSSEEDRGLGVKRLDFKRTRWLAVLLPALYVGLFEFLRHQWLEPILPLWLGHGWLGNLMAASVVAAVVYIFVRFFAKVLQESALELAWVREQAAVAVERQRIARETHDSIAQTLFYLTVELGEVEDLVLAGQEEEAHKELQMVREEIKATHHKVKEVIRDLKQQAELEDFEEAVRRTATELANRLEMEVTLEISGSVYLPDSSRQHVLAILKEALTNAHRHSGTQHATVRLKTAGKGAELEVSDKGAGFDWRMVSREGRYGLVIMKERAHMAGGQLDLDSIPGQGTRVTVHLPGAAL